MQAMINSTQAFMDPLEQWVKAIRVDDFAAAKQHAERLIHDGELLARNPDFQSCFAKHCDGFDASQALYHLCQFLVYATDGRARVLKQYLADRKPT